MHVSLEADLTIVKVPYSQVSVDGIKGADAEVMNGNVPVSPVHLQFRFQAGWHKEVVVVVKEGMGAEVS